MFFSEIAILFAVFYFFTTGDTAMHLGSAMDELMRHQPTLKRDAMKAIIKVIKVNHYKSWGL